MLFKHSTPPRPQTPRGAAVSPWQHEGKRSNRTRVVGAVSLQPGRAQTGLAFLHKISQISSFHPKAAVAALVALSHVSVPAPRRSPESFCLGTFLFSRGSRPARRSSGKMAAPTSRGSRDFEPGAAPYGNFPNYSRFHPPEGRVSLLPPGLLRSLFPAATRPLLGLDVGCNSGVRARHAAGSGRLGGTGWGQLGRHRFGVLGALGLAGGPWCGLLGDAGTDWRTLVWGHRGTLAVPWYWGHWDTLGGTGGQSSPWKRLGMRHRCGAVQTGNAGGERRRRAMGQTGNTGKGKDGGAEGGRWERCGGHWWGALGAMGELGRTGAGSAGRGGGRTGSSAGRSGQMGTLGGRKSWICSIPLGIGAPPCPGQPFPSGISPKIEPKPPLESASSHSVAGSRS